MKLLDVLKRRPLVLPLAAVAAAGMLAISESAYWLALATLDTLGASASATERIEGRQALYGILALGRSGVAVLSVACLLALYIVLRQALALERAQLLYQQALRDERDRLELEVAGQVTQLTALTQHLLTAREDERSRLARNLHDELGALLTSAKLDAARIRSRLAGQAPEALERLAHLVGTLDSSIALGRRIVEDLHPSTLGNLGLVAALDILVREFAAQAGVQAHLDLAPVPLSPAAELVVYRCVQEALTNLGKHAQARQVWVGLQASGDGVLASVRDDGVGFDTRAQPRSAYGLLGMRYRVQAEGGALLAQSAPGLGSTLQIRLPASGVVVCGPSPTPEGPAP
jgi:signal transduction histidine kinase